MEIRYAGKALVEKYVGLYSRSNNAMVREVDIAIGLTRDAFELVFGSEMAEVVFASYLKDEAGIGQWKLKSAKPAKCVVCEQHKIDIEGIGIDCQPRVKAWTPIGDSESVVAVISLRLGQPQVKLRRLLEDCVGVLIDIDIKPSQMDLSDGTTNLSDRHMEIVKNSLESAVPA